MKLSIVVVHFRKPELLKLCLDSIKNTVKLTDYEIIVVDSMSSRASQQLMRERYPEIKFLPFSENLGYARGVNIGLQQATGEYILIMNYDIIVPEHSLDAMVSYMEANRDIGMLGPQIRYLNDTLQNSYFRYYTPATIIARRTPLGKLNYFKKISDDFLMTDTDPNQLQTPDWIMGAMMLISRTAYEAVGGMDERFFFYFEDVDWCRRIWHAGFKVVYYPKAMIYHYLGRGSKSGLGIFDIFFNTKTRWHIKSAIKFFWKYRTLEQFKKSV